MARGVCRECFAVGSKPTSQFPARSHWYRDFRRFALAIRFLSGKAAMERLMVCRQLTGSPFEGALGKLAEHVGSVSPPRALFLLQPSGTYRAWEWPTVQSSLNIALAGAMVQMIIGRPAGMGEV
jgi:hypothetical protein